MFVLQTCPDSRPRYLCGPLLPSPLRKDLRSWRPSAGGSCPSSSTPSGSDFPGFSFGFCKTHGRHWHCAERQPAGRPWAPPADLHRDTNPTTPRAHLSRGVWAAGAPGARFPQRATLGLRQEALAVQRGFDEARIAVELHQVEDLRRRRRAVSCGGHSASRQGSRPGPGAWLHRQLRGRAPSPSLPQAPPLSPSFTVDSRLPCDPRPAPTFSRAPASRSALFPTPSPPSLTLRPLDLAPPLPRPAPFRGDAPYPRPRPLGPLTCSCWARNMSGRGSASTSSPSQACRSMFTGLSAWLDRNSW